MTAKEPQAPTTPAQDARFTIAGALGHLEDERAFDPSAPVSVPVQLGQRDAEAISSRAAAAGLTTSQYLYQAAMDSLADTARP